MADDVMSDSDDNRWDGDEPVVTTVKPSEKKQPQLVVPTLPKRKRNMFRVEPHDDGDRDGGDGDDGAATAVNANKSDRDRGGGGGKTDGKIKKQKNKSEVTITTATLAKRMKLPPPKAATAAAAAAAAGPSVRHQATTTTTTTTKKRTTTGKKKREKKNQQSTKRETMSEWMRNQRFAEMVVDDMAAMRIDPSFPAPPPRPILPPRTSKKKPPPPSSQPPTQSSDSDSDDLLLVVRPSANPEKKRKAAARDITPSFDSAPDRQLVLAREMKRQKGTAAAAAAAAAAAGDDGDRHRPWRRAPSLPSLETVDVTSSHTGIGGVVVEGKPLGVPKSKRQQRLQTLFEPNLPVPATKDLRTVARPPLPRDARAAATTTPRVILRRRRQNMPSSSVPPPQQQQPPPPPPPRRPLALSVSNATAAAIRQQLAPLVEQKSGSTKRPVRMLQARTSTPTLAAVHDLSVSLLPSRLYVALAENFNLMMAEMVAMARRQLPQSGGIPPRTEFESASDYTAHWRAVLADDLHHEMAGRWKEACQQEMVCTFANIDSQPIESSLPPPDDTKNGDGDAVARTWRALVANLPATEPRVHRAQLQFVGSSARQLNEHDVLAVAPMSLSSGQFTLDANSVHLMVVRGGVSNPVVDSDGGNNNDDYDNDNARVNVNVDIHLMVPMLADELVCREKCKCVRLIGSKQWCRMLSAVHCAPALRWRDLLLRPAAFEAKSTADTEAAPPFVWPNEINAFATRMIAELNESQVDAITSAVCPRPRLACTLIHGPPGTGKTRTLAYCVVALLLLDDCRRRTEVQRLMQRPLDDKALGFFAQRTQIMCSAPSNAATDEIARRLVDTVRMLEVSALCGGRAVQVLRAGNSKVVDASVLELTDGEWVRNQSAIAVENARNGHERAVVNTELHSCKAELRRSWEAGSVDEVMRVGHEYRALLDRKAALRPDEVSMLAYNQHDVVVATSAGTNRIIDLVRRQSKVTVGFVTLIVDEAAQATELDTLMAMGLDSVRSVVLVGDPQQLPPTVTHTGASSAVLERSLYRRLTEGGGHTSFLLNTQYRMEAPIAALPSVMFYGGQLKNGPNMSHRPPYLMPAGFNYGADIGGTGDQLPVYAFFDVYHGKQTSHGTSRYNASEAHTVVRLLRDVFRHFPLCPKSQIGIITPYDAQARVLRRHFNTETTDCGGVEVSSIDGFQGREKDIVIVSMVVTGASVGFARCKKRMNVLLTRARHHCWIVGNARALSSDASWRQIIDDARQRGVYFDDSQ